MIKEPKVNKNNTLTTIELFAGAGGLALGLEKSGFNHVLLNEKDNGACSRWRILTRFTR